MYLTEYVGIDKLPMAHVVERIWIKPGENGFRVAMKAHKTGVSVTSYLMRTRKEAEDLLLGICKLGKFNADDFKGGGFRDNPKPKEVTK